MIGLLNFRLTFIFGHRKGMICDLIVGLSIGWNLYELISKEVVVFALR